MRCNEVISDLFSRLRFMERRGSGIGRILNTYSEHPKEPQFFSSESSFLVVLPNRNAVQNANEPEHCETKPEKLRSDEEKVRLDGKKVQLYEVKVHLDGEKVRLDDAKVHPDGEKVRLIPTEISEKNRELDYFQNHLFLP